MEPINPRKLRPAVLARLLNSTGLGAVISERQLRRHRNDGTTVEEIVEKMEALYGQANRIRAMDRGMGSDDNIELLKQGGRRYIIGTSKSMLRQFEQHLLDKDWWSIRDGLEVKLCESPDVTEPGVAPSSSGARRKRGASGPSCPKAAKSFPATSPTGRPRSCGTPTSSSRRPRPHSACTRATFASVRCGTRKPSKCNRTSSCDSWPRCRGRRWLSSATGRAWVRSRAGCWTNWARSASWTSSCQGAKASRFAAGCAGRMTTSRSFWGISA